MGKINPRLIDLFARLDALYATLPTIQCQGRCAIACGSIPLTDLEARRLQLAMHVKPRTVPDGFPALADFIPAGPLRERCIYLDARDRCTAYAVRPLICRVWGLVRAMSCMHGCVPDRWLRDTDFVALAQEIERLGGGRVLHTTPDGLATDPAERFANLKARRSEAAIDADSERTRTLRALHGGRILAVVKENP